MWFMLGFRCFWGSFWQICYCFKRCYWCSPFSRRSSCLWQYWYGMQRWLIIHCLELSCVYRSSIRLMLPLHLRKWCNSLMPCRKVLRSYCGIQEIQVQSRQCRRDDHPRSTEIRNLLKWTNWNCFPCLPRLLLLLERSLSACYRNSRRWPCYQSYWMGQRRWPWLLALC